MQPAGVAICAASGSHQNRDAPRQGPWKCGNCPKGFTQKEYRDKHQRRCIQASSRQKQSKQKSCVACASSKLGCDLGTPSCSRCINRNKHCRYVSLTAVDTSAQQQQQTQQSPQKNNNNHKPDQQHSHQQGPQSGILSNGIQGQFLYLENEAHSNLDKNVGSQDMHSTDTSPELDTMRVTTHSNQDRASTNLMVLPTCQPQDQHHPSAPTSSLTFSGWQMESPPHDRRENSEQLLDGPLRSVGASPYWYRQNLDAFTAGSESDESIPRWQRDRLWPAGSPFMSGDGALSAEMEDINGNIMTGISNDDLNFDLLGSLGVLTRNQITLAPQHSPLSAVLRPASTISPGLNSSQPARGVVSHDQSSPRVQEDMDIKGTLHDAVNAVRGGASLSAAVLDGKFEENGRQRCPFHKLNTADNLVRIICNYPRVMVRPGEYPPFVHHKLYRCAAGDISEPLARAFCCVGAFYSSVPSSETFVYSLINEESSKLVKIFHQWSGSDSDMLAVVHAMCIYQILGFFVTNSPALVRLSELLHLFFLKMTRRLIQQHLQPTTEGETDEVNWRKWIMKETIRRTVFLVNTINTLSCRIQKQNPYYFEPLDDNLVRNMRLPAPDSVWKASSAEEWMAATARLEPEDTARSALTVQQIVDQFVEDGNSNSHQNNNTCRVQYEQLDTFTRLIIATASND